MVPSEKVPADPTADRPASPASAPLAKLGAPVQRVVSSARQARGFFERILRTKRFIFLKVLRQKGTPKQIAMGVAVGVFIGLTVPPLLQFVMAIALAFPLRYSKVGAMLGTMVTNPLTMPLIYPGEVLLGMWVTGIDIQVRIPEDRHGWWQILTNWQLHSRALMVLSVGALLTGVVFSIPSYYLTKWAVIGHRRRREQRIMARALRRAHHLAEENALLRDDAKPPTAT
jgi:uncharacterized protein